MATISRGPSGSPRVRVARTMPSTGTMSMPVDAMVAGISVGLSFLIFGALAMPLVMAGLTIGGLLASATPLHRLQGTDIAGEYMIQVFCAAVGCQVQLSELMGSSGPILLFTACIMLSTITLHMLLAKLFRHDVDTTLMASAATIYGPPFVAPVAEAIGM